MHWVKTAEYKNNYEIIVGFENGEVKIANLDKCLDKGIFVALKKLNEFKKFRVNHDTDTIEWENGADLSPDYLYEIGVSIKQPSKAA
jgi:hypothetical protein